MSKSRLIITAVAREHISQAEAARRYGISPGRISKLLARWRTEGEAAFEPRSRRPHHSPTATPENTAAHVLSLRAELTAAGLDAGTDTIAWHLRTQSAAVGPEEVLGAAVEWRVCVCLSADELVDRWMWRRRW